MDDDLLAAVKAEAAAFGETMTAFIEEAVRRQLAERRSVAVSPAPEIPVFAGDGLLPGVDLDDAAAPLNLMEEG